jgi:hypothetical protein
MNNQIKLADFVLIICTEVYSRRATGQESPGAGLGVSWEGQLITQQIYENGGRNTKFIPVIFLESDIPHVPNFLASSSRFSVGTPSGRDNLYRFLTAQPAVLKPPLGPLRHLSSQPDQIALPITGDVQERRTFTKTDEPLVIWRLPRGFILTDSLLKTSYASWATKAYYFDYGGREIHGTHYHESYKWLDNIKVFHSQFAKLSIQRGDWMFAKTSLYFMVDVRENRCSVSREGIVSGSFSETTLREHHATIFTKGDIPLPTMPLEYRPLSISGPLRDLAAEADDLLYERGPSKQEKLGEDFAESVGRIRREVRIEIHRKLEQTHPACKNLEEIIVGYQPTNEAERLRWLSEFTAATWEAVRCIEYQVA